MTVIFNRVIFNVRYLGGEGPIDVVSKLRSGGVWQRTSITCQKAVRALALVKISEDKVFICGGNIAVF